MVHVEFGSRPPSWPQTEVKVLIYSLTPKRILSSNLDFDAKKGSNERVRPRAMRGSSLG